MSKESVKAFYLKLVQDEQLANRVNAAASVEERLATARSVGCEFTRDEFVAVTGEIMESEASFAQFFGGEQGEVVAHAAFLMVPVQNVLRPLYKDSWFFETGRTGQLRIIR